LNRKQREDFVLQLPTNVQTMLNQDFGKPNLKQTFTADARFRHVLAPLFRSGFLQKVDYKSLSKAGGEARTFTDLWHEYSRVDFRPLQGFPKGWESETEVNSKRVRWTTAAVLHVDVDLAATVRWIGGPHVGAHRDVPQILATVQAAVDAGHLDQESCNDLERILRHGSPALCNAHASEENFQAFHRHGNHKSANHDAKKTMDTLVKDSKRGFCLVLDKRILPFIIHGHQTPLGMVNLDHHYKKPRNIFDSTFRPAPWAHSINDWTNKANEPPITFPQAKMDHLVWLYNLRITYPDQEILLGDDDITRIPPASQVPSRPCLHAPV
jgi:hypothetical protein